MEIRVEGMDFGFGNPVAEIGGVLDLQKIWLELWGGGGGFQPSVGSRDC